MMIITMQILKNRVVNYGTKQPVCYRIAQVIKDYYSTSENNTKRSQIHNFHRHISRDTPQTKGHPLPT